MSGLKKGLKVSLPGIVAGSFLGRKRTRHAAHTSLAHSTPRMLCVNTHTIPRAQAGPNALPDRLFPTDVGGSLRTLGTTLHHKVSGRETNNWIFQVLFPLFQSRSISSQNVVFGFWVTEFLSSVLGCLHFPKGFRFWIFNWLLYTGCPTHFFVVTVQFLPVSTFNTFEDCLAECMPISINQSSPHLSCAM